MAWIESHQTLGSHRKLLRLAKALAVSRAQAIGHLHLFWWWCLDNAPSGQLGDVTDEELATVSDWSGDPKTYADALRSCGWIDPSGTVHDWHDYAGRLMVRREQAKERMRNFRERSHTLRERARNLRERSADSTQPNPTVPNPTVPSTPPPVGESKGKQGEAATTPPKRRATARPAVSDEDWLKALEASEAYRGIDVPTQVAKCRLWCSTNAKTPSRRRIVNWLNRCEKPVNGHSAPAQALPLWQQVKLLDEQAKDLTTRIGSMPAGDERTAAIRELDGLRRRKAEAVAKGMQ